MSASNEKKNRTDGTVSKRAAAAAEEAKKNKKFMRNTIIVIVAVVVLVAAALVINSNLLYTRTTAVTVGDTKYSPAEFNYFYTAATSELYQSLASQYGDQAASIMNLQMPLSQQPYFGDPELTWADIVTDRAISNMEEVTVFYDAAVKEGYTLSEEAETSKSESLSEMAMYAALSGVSIDQYLAANFGKGMDSTVYADIMDKVFLAEEYSGNLLSSLVYNDEELAAYYAEHANEYNYYDYYSYSVNFANKSFDNADDKKAAAHAEAEKIAAATSSEEFISLVRAFAGEDTSVIMSHNTSSGLISAYRDWLKDPARVAGDTAVIDTDTACYAMFFVGLDTNEYPYVDMRHILINAVADEDGTYSEEALNTAKARAEELLAEWQADPTEDHFAEMANEYSEDAGSNTNGGLYSDVTKHHMVNEINDFLFAEDRQVGDTAVVYGNNGSYAGYHVVYCSAIHENLCTTLARNGKTVEDYNAAYEALKGDAYEIVQGKGMKYTVA